MKLNINGYAQHGKDTVADLFCKEANLVKVSASHIYARLIMDLKVLGPYDSIEECYQDRVNHRKVWYDFIRRETKYCPSYFVDLCLAEGDMYVGHRSRWEFEQTKEHFDATIWVDASERGLLQEPEDSCNLTVHGHDYVIDNGMSLAVTRNQVKMITRLINNRKVAENAYT